MKRRGNTFSFVGNRAVPNCTCILIVESEIYNKLLTKASGNYVCSNVDHTKILSIRGSQMNELYEPEPNKILDNLNSRIYTLLYNLPLQQRHH